MLKRFNILLLKFRSASVKLCLPSIAICLVAAQVVKTKVECIIRNVQRSDGMTEEEEMSDTEYIAHREVSARAS